MKGKCISTRWDNKVEDASLNCMITETVARVCEAGSIGGNWYVNGHKIKVLVDVSSVAMGVVLEVNKNIIEDASWLYPTGDT